MNKIELVRDTEKSVQVFIDGQKQERVSNVHMDFDAERRKMVLVISQDSRVGVRKHNVYTDFTLSYASEVVPTETIDDRMRQAWGADNTHMHRVKVIDDIYQGAVFGPEFAVSGESPSSEQDGHDSFDCPHAHAARTCGCGFCRALQVSETTRTLMEQLAARDTKGREKYGTTLDRKDLSLVDWLQHQTEELLDGAGYAQAAKREAKRLLLIEKAAHLLCDTMSGKPVGTTVIDALNYLRNSLLP